MRKKCFVDRSIKWSEENRRILENIDLDFITYEKHNVNYEEIDYLLLHSFLSDEEIEKMINCKYIGIRANNTDYVNIKTTNEKKIFVDGLKIQHAVNAVAEHTFGLIFAITKNILNSHNNVVEGQWRNNLKLNYEIYGKKLGIIGYGEIGKKVAEIGKMLGMEVLIAGKIGSEKYGELSLEEVLKESDVITLHLSSKEENRKYINKDRLKMMKNNSILINTARGFVLDYDALEEEIKNNRFLGVGLDVFSEEPPKENKLFKYSNVVLTPHVGFMTKETISKMNQELISNIWNYISKDVN